MLTPGIMPPNANLFYYQIIVSGSLHEKWSDWFGGLEIGAGRTADGSQITILKGAIKDQAALRGVLLKLLDLNLVLISVQQIQPSPDDQETSSE